MENNNCSKCGAQFVADGIAAGYAKLQDDSRICYACADEMQRAEMLDRSKPFCAYISADGKRITTWSGGKLGDIVSHSSVRVMRTSYLHGEYMWAIVVRDVHGAYWYGRGSPGIAVTLRPRKSGGR